MLPFVQGLRLTNTTTDTELSIAAGKIYRQYFEQKVKFGNPKNYRDQICNMVANMEKEHKNQFNERTDNDIWIFGYGSLVWKANFPFIERRRGFICGYKRRFYQHSIDHRGIPEKPGRVVTLLPGDVNSDRVYGIAYRIAAKNKSEVLDHLDYREKNGYERVSAEFHEYPTTTMPIEVIMYLASHTNDSYAGDVFQIPSIAKQICTSTGPSGSNREYLFNLSIAMHELFPDAIDEHLTELVDCVERFIAEDEPKLLERALTEEIKSEVNNFLTRCSSIEPDEEFVKVLKALLAKIDERGWREKYLNKAIEMEEKMKRSEL